MNWVENLLLYIVSLSDNLELALDLYGQTFSVFVVLVLLGIVSLMALGLRGRGLWAKNLTMVIGTILIAAIGLGFILQTSHPRRLSEEWMMSHSGPDGGIKLAFPPKPRPEIGIIEVIIDRGTYSSFRYIPLTTKEGESMGKMMKEYVQNKRAGQMKIKIKEGDSAEFDSKVKGQKVPFKLPASGEKSLERYFEFYYIPADEQESPEKVRPGEGDQVTDQGGVLPLGGATP